MLQFLQHTPNLALHKAMVTGLVVEGTPGEDARISGISTYFGSSYPDLWVSRLAAMVAGQLGEPHRFVVYTDRPEPGRFGEPIASHQQLVQQDLETGSLRGYFSKLRLFDQALTGSDPFLFLDSTLVIRADLAPLVELGRNASASLMGVRDWNYPILNSSVLWCRCPKPAGSLHHPQIPRPAQARGSTAPLAPSPAHDPAPSTAAQALGLSRRRDPQPLALSRLEPG